MNLQDGPLDKGLLVLIDKGWLVLIGPLIVLPPWIWMAVRTQHCLQVITVHSIPFTKRTIWLMKTLALIVGVGGLFGVVVQVGLPWLLAILPGGVIVFFALKESVQEVVPPKPSQDAAAYQSSWETYSSLRSDFLRSWRWVGASLVGSNRQALLRFFPLKALVRRCQSVREMVSEFRRSDPGTTREQ